MNFWSPPFLALYVARSQKSGDKNRTELDWKWDGKGLVWLGSRAKKGDGGGKEGGHDAIDKSENPLARYQYLQPDRGR